MSSLTPQIVATSELVDSSDPSRGGRKTTSKAEGNRFGWILLSVLSVLSIYPLLWILFTSLKTESEYISHPIGLPIHPTLALIRQVMSSGNALQDGLNSFLVVVPAVAIVSALSISAGYALSCMRFRLRGVILLCIIAMMAVPSTVLMIPTFRTLQTLGLLDQRAGLVLVYSVLYLPLSIYLAATNFRSLPREMFEAAAVDGASPLQIFWSIGRPLAGPTTRTIITLNFIWLWNELLFGLLILQSAQKRTLMAGLAALQGEHSTPVPLLAAGLLISLIPTLLVFLFVQRSLTHGLTAGAIK